MGLRHALLAGDFRVASSVVEDETIRFVLRRSQVGEPRPTAREQQVLELAVEGQSNKAIGITLGVPPSRVSESLRRVAHKLGARSWVTLLPLIAGIEEEGPSRTR